MSLVEKKWWKKIFAKPERNRIDIQNDLQAIIEYLEDVPAEVTSLHMQLKELEELEKEHTVIRPSLRSINLEAQAKLLDKILVRYDFFHNDAEINSHRLKLIAKELLKRAEHAGLKDFVEERKDDPLWRKRI